METIVSIRQLHKNLGRIARRVKKGERVLVLRHSEPMFVLTPYEEKRHLARVPKYGLADLQKLKVKGGDRNISRKIDKIVYDI